MVLTRKVRGYARCRKDAQMLTDRELVATIRLVRDKRSQMNSEEKACFEALEDEVLNRVIEQY